MLEVKVLCPDPAEHKCIFIEAPKQRSTHTFVKENLNLSLQLNGKYCGFCGHTQCVDQNLLESIKVRSIIVYSYNLTKKYLQ